MLQRILFHITSNLPYLGPRKKKNDHSTSVLSLFPARTYIVRAGSSAQIGRVPPPNDVLVIESAPCDTELHL